MACCGQHNTDRWHFVSAQDATNRELLLKEVQMTTLCVNLPHSVVCPTNIAGLLHRGATCTPPVLTNNKNPRSLPRSFVADRGVSSRGSGYRRLACPVKLTADNSSPRTLQRELTLLDKLGVASEILQCQVSAEAYIILKRDLVEEQTLLSWASCPSCPDVEVIFDASHCLRCLDAYRQCLT